MRRGKVIAASAAGLLVIASVGTVVTFKAMHPRDEAAYLRYETVYGDYHGGPIRHMPDTADVVAAGDEACQWLSGQPIAGWRTSTEFGFPAVMGRYLTHTGTTALPWSGPPERTAIAAGAWAYLCPGVWVVHKPHYIFTRPHHD